MQQRERLTSYPLHTLHNKRFKLWIEPKGEFSLLWAINNSKSKEWLLNVYENKTNKRVPRIGNQKR